MVIHLILHCVCSNLELFLFGQSYFVFSTLAQLDELASQ